MMELVLRDDRLNISPSYLRPGFAFGGSCLPKDLRALLHLARVNNVDLPLLAGTLHSNEITVSDVVDRVIAHGGRNVALLGLSFKTKTDDLRESPNVDARRDADRQGLQRPDLRPDREPEPPRRCEPRYVESQLPHLRRLLVDTRRRGARRRRRRRSSRPPSPTSPRRCSRWPPPTC